MPQWLLGPIIHETLLIGRRNRGEIQFTALFPYPQSVSTTFVKLAKYEDLCYSFLHLALPCFFKNHFKVLYHYLSTINMKTQE